MNIQNLKKNLEAGKHVIVQDIDYYIIISPFKDEEGNYRESGHFSRIEAATKEIGSYDGRKPQFYSKFKFIGIYEPEFETFKVGDKVLVSKDAEKWCKKFGLEWEIKKTELVDTIITIREVKLDRIVADESSWWFPPQALSYPMEEEDDEVEKAIKLLTAKGKLKDGKILI